ncbi:baculoviral IAP repeat-containing protein 7-B-like isoform X2 [Penaeus indicus]|uniref:baculoviral IAP repeat-containing protein 7-B-like isoform X2 n=1 Tax=Penaeus indicus TaxID=29960 RepID=UPI00300C24D0
MIGMKNEEQCSRDRVEESSPREQRCFLSPLDLLFEAVRRLTFARWDESQLSSTQLAQSGFFFTGVKDHVQCIFCLGVLGCWSPGEQPDEEHRKQFPECPLVTGAPTGNIPVDASSREGTEGRLYQLLREYYLLRLSNMQFSEGISPGGSAWPLTDAYPQFQTPASRLATFAGRPADVGPSPRDLAAAGFFHTGKADWLQCFCCGGGIFGWQEGEQPLEVHLRYYPLCPFARVAAAPDPSRPEPSFPPGVAGGYKGALAIQTEDVELLGQHPLAKRLVEMGVPQTVVKSAFKQRLETYGALCRTILEAVEWTVEYKKPGKHSPQLVAPSTNRFSHSHSLQTESPHQQNLNPSSTYDEKAEKLRREVEDLKQQIQAQEDRLLCRVCKQDRVAIVLQPCSHMHLCVSCARSRDTCPSCEIVIRGTLRPRILV